MLKCYIFPVLYFAVETWILNRMYERKIEALAMWTYRRMLRISWVEHTTNAEVLTRMNKDLEVLKEVKWSKITYHT